MDFSNKRIRIIIADDHEVYLGGLEKMISGIPEVELIDTCRNGRQLVQSVAKNRPDVVLTDIQMPELSGIEAIKEIKSNHPQIGILVLSNFDSEYKIVEALQAGAKGYISKSMPNADLLEAIKEVSMHNPYLCKSSSFKLTRMLIHRGLHQNRIEHIRLFTEMELQIVKLICEEKTVKEIAATLFKSERTIENHRARLFEKMGVKTTTGIAMYAVKNGLVDPS
jgi:DNA-binding NarL/FixJ family response regulator